MKYIVLVPDGMADEPIPQLGYKTPLEIARKPNMDAMALSGFSGLVQTIPDGLPPGSDIGNLSLLGYDPLANYSGRASLEAANMGIVLREDEVIFRCNLVTIKNDIMVDYSAGHISSEEAATMIEALNKSLGSADLKFYSGKSYRHLLVIRSRSAGMLFKMRTTPPHDIIEKKIREFLTGGEFNDTVLAIMTKAHDVLKNHPVNLNRVKRGETAATDIWLWGQGIRPNLPNFKTKFGINGSIISAVDLVNGIGRLAGLDIISVPGATGYYDTDYAAKGRYALDSLSKKDYVYIHVESPDEAGHNGDYKEKIRAIEQIDEHILGPIRKWSEERNDVRMLVSPDHPTPVVKRTHTRAPVCFFMCGQGITSNRVAGFNENVALCTGIKFNSGEELIRRFFKE